MDEKSMELRAASIIDPTIEGHYAFFPLADQISMQHHYHDFYEVFLIVNGAIQHHINDRVIRLDAGTLAFIRPQDAHHFSKIRDINCELINLAFLRETFRALCNYLSFDPHKATFIVQPEPVSVLLTLRERQLLTDDLRDWGRRLYQDKQISRRILRGLLAYIISTYFISRQSSDTPAIPAWLETVCREMQKPQHLIEGRDALMRLAQRTPAHVGRSFQSYLEMTPSDFINQLRLDYAGDLLLQTDHSPARIAHDAGFGSVSHFYHLFKARWGCSPNEYRTLNRRPLNP
jgi:AraC family cel operon transcriptional repressor